MNQKLSGKPGAVQFGRGWVDTQDRIGTLFGTDTGKTSLWRYGFYFLTTCTAAREHKYDSVRITSRLSAG